MGILIRQEERGQLQLQNPDAPWCGVIWAENAMRPTPPCTSLFVHLLGGRLDEEEFKKLQEKFATARDSCPLSCLTLGSKGAAFKLTNSGRNYGIAPPLLGFFGHFHPGRYPQFSANRNIGRVISEYADCKSSSAGAGSPIVGICRKRKSTKYDSISGPSDHCHRTSTRRGAAF